MSTADICTGACRISPSRTDCDCGRYFSPLAHIARDLAHLDRRDRVEEEVIASGACGSS
jgi:hypothetical protein